jgi:hypothetical protein
MSNIDKYIRSFDLLFDESNSKILVSELVELLKFTNNEQYFLKKNNSDFNLLEQFVYDISNFFLFNNKIEINNEIEVSFRLLNRYNKPHLDYDGIPIKPIFSYIVYLNNNKNNNDYSLFTNINNSSYKYKDYYDSDNVFYFVNPKVLKLIEFDSTKFYHNHISLENEMHVLLIDVWKIKGPIDLNIYNDDNNNLTVKYSKLNINESCIKTTVNLEKIILDKRALFDDIFYNNNINSYDFLHKCIINNCVNLLCNNEENNIDVTPKTSDSSQGCSNNKISDNYDFIQVEILNDNIGKQNIKKQSNDKKLKSIKFDIPHKD